MHDPPLGPPSSGAEIFRRMCLRVGGGQKFVKIVLIIFLPFPAILSIFRLKKKLKTLGLHQNRSEKNQLPGLPGSALRVSVGWLEKVVHGACGHFFRIEDIFVQNSRTYSYSKFLFEG